MNTRLKPTWLSVKDAPEKFTVEVKEYGISTDGQYGESDYIVGDIEGRDRKVKLNQTSLLYLHEHKIAPTEENLSKRLPGRKLIFMQKKIGQFMALVVVGIVAKKGGS